MFTKIHWIETHNNGASLGIMPRPRGHDALEGEIKNLRQAGVQTIVCLLEGAEIYELGLRNEQALCEQFGIEYIHLPIVDRGTPTSLHAVKVVVKRVREKLHNGESSVIHCRMGIGRSAIIAGAILLNSHTSAENVLTSIGHARGLGVPDTTEQKRWLKQFEI